LLRAGKHAGLELLSALGRFRIRQKKGAGIMRPPGGGLLTVW